MEANLAKRNEKPPNPCRRHSTRLRPKNSVHHTKKPKKLSDAWAQKYVFKYEYEEKDEYIQFHEIQTINLDERIKVDRSLPTPDGERKPKRNAFY